MDITFTIDPDTALRAALHERGLACWTEETGGGCQALGVRPAGAGPHPIDAPVVLVTDNDASLPWTSWSATGQHTILAATYEALGAWVTNHGLSVCRAGDGRGCWENCVHGIGDGPGAAVCD